MIDESDYLRRLIEDMVDAELRGCLLWSQTSLKPLDIAIRVAGAVSRRLQDEGIEVTRR